MQVLTDLTLDVFKLFRRNLRKWLSFEDNRRSNCSKDAENYVELCATERIVSDWNSNWLTRVRDITIIS